MGGGQSLIEDENRRTTNPGTELVQGGGWAQDAAIGPKRDSSCLGFFLVSFALRW